MELKNHIKDFETPFRLALFNCHHHTSVTVHVRVRRKIAKFAKVVKSFSYVRRHGWAFEGCLNLITEKGTR